MCVVAQVLGVPGTVIELLTTSDILMESISEDASFGPVMPELATLRSSRIQTIVPPSVHLPLFVTVVFHPPLAEQ